MVKICSKCKLELPIESFHKHPNGAKGLRPRCIECVREQNNSASGKYSSYKADAKRRGLNWELTKNKFCELWEANCFYCGDEHTFGIDRVDNSIGYYDNNVVSCCSTCNYAKGTMSSEVFLKMIEKIFKNTAMVRR